MTEPMGLLLVTMEPPAPLEEEFADWYDLEHFPQRRAMPGFLNGSRWRCIDGWPKWLALYDLSTVAALDTPEYRAVSGPNSTPWSRRMLPRTMGRQRVAARQIAPGAATLPDPADIGSLVAARFTVDDAASISFANTIATRTHSLAGHLQTRVFAAGGPENTDIWALIAFDRSVASAVARDAIGEVDGHGARVLNIYVPYFRG